MLQRNFLTVADVAADIMKPLLVLAKAKNYTEENGGSETDLLTITSIEIEQ